MQVFPGAAKCGLSLLAAVYCPACFSEILQMKASLSFLACACAKRESWPQAFLAETMKTGDKNRDVTDNIKTIFQSAMHVLW